MTDVKRIAEGFFWNHLGRSLEYLLSFLFTVLIARFLGSEINGIYASILSLVFLLNILSSLGLETSVNSLFPKYFGQEISKASRTIKKLILFRIAVSGIVAFFLYIFKLHISNLFNISQTVLEYFIFIVFFFTLRSIISLLNSFFITFFKTRACYSFAVSIRTLELVLLYFFLLNGYGLKEIFVFLTVTNLLHIILLTIYFWKIILNTEKEIIKLKEVIALGSKFWLNSLFEFFFGKQTVILILGIFAISYYDIGNFDVSFSFAQALNMGLTIGLYGVSVSAFSTIEGKGIKALEAYWSAINRFVLIVLIPGFIFVLVFAKELILAVYTDQYVKSILWFQVFSAIFLLTRIIGGGLSADYLQSKGKVKELLTSSLVCGIINILTAIFLVKYFGVNGAVVSLATSSLLIALLHYYFVKQIFNAKLNIVFALKLVIISLICGLSVLQLNSLIEIQNILTSLLIYILMVVLAFRLLKPLDYSDVEMIEKVNSGVASIAKRYASIQTDLTDRQKWAFSWLPESNLVVDIGCSNTPLINYLHTKSRIIIGVDTDLNALRSIEKDKVYLIAGSAENIPVETGIADAVLMLDVLEHLKNDRMALAEVWRILKPGGVLILSVPYKGLFSFLDPQNLSMKLRKSKQDRYHKHYSIKDLKVLLFRLFKIEKVHYGGLFLYPITFGASNFLKRHLGLDLSNFFRKIGDIDNNISWGRLSYNILLIARKI